MSFFARCFGRAPSPEPKSSPPQPTVVEDVTRVQNGLYGLATGALDTGLQNAGLATYMTTVDDAYNVIPLNVASPGGATNWGPASSGKPAADAARGLGAGGHLRGLGTVSEPLQQYTHDSDMENSGEHHGVPWIPEGDELENDPPALAPFLLVDNPADPEATEVRVVCETGARRNKTGLRLSTHRFDTLV